MSIWQGLVGLACGLLVVYLALLALLWGYARRHPEAMTMREALRLLPDIVRLVRRLVADPALPRSVRVLSVLLLVYLASPIDLVPDFIPVLGYADDAVVVALVLRSVVRRAGPDALSGNWPGTPEGLHLVRKLVGLPAPPAPPPPPPQSPPTC